MSVNEGFNSAVSFLKDVVIRETAGQAWWVYAAVVERRAT